MSKRVNQANLQRFLANNFNEDEQRRLCLVLDVNYDALPGSGTAAKATSLVEHCRNHNMLLRLADVTAAARPNLDTTPLWQDTSLEESPFKGLLVFEESDADIFYGRNNLTDELSQRIIQADSLGQSAQFLALVGTSGSGKSSVVRAGLIPAIRTQTNWPVHLITPGMHPVEALAVNLTRDSESLTAATTLMDDMMCDQRSLDLYVKRMLTGTPEIKQLLLVVDQYEELFTLSRTDEERQAFIDNLVYAVDSNIDGKLVVIITLRADFYGRCLQYHSLHTLLENHQKIIPGMTLEELREAIEYPAQYAGLTYEDGLVDLILREVGEEPGNLPLLSHALLETWKRREGTQLTLAQYNEAGGVQKAIAKTAESTYQKLTEDQQNIARNIFVRLTELGEGTTDTRRRASVQELTNTTGEVEVVLKILADARLVTTGRDIHTTQDGSVNAPQAYAEVSHEALIRQWPTLQNWLNDDRDNLRIYHQLIDAAQDWAEHGEDRSYLYRGIRLDTALHWAATHEQQMNQQELAFLEASQQERHDRQAAKEEQNRKLRQRALYLFGALVVASLLAVVSFFLFWQAQEAVINADRSLATAVASEQVAITAQKEAEQKNRLALSRELANQAAYFHEIDPDLSLLLAAEAVSITHHADNLNTVEATAMLRSLLTLMGTITPITYTIGGAPWYLHFDPTGELLAAAGEDGVHLWDLGINKEIELENMVRYHIEDNQCLGCAQAMSFNHDGTRLAVGDWTGEVGFWDTQTGQQLWRKSFPDELITDLAIDPTSHILAVSGKNGILYIFDTMTGDLIDEVQEGAVTNRLDLSNDGRFVAESRDDGSGVFLYDIQNDKFVTLANLPQPDTLNDILFTPDTNFIIASSLEGPIYIWDMVSRQIRHVLTGHIDIVRDIDIDPSGTWLVSASFDGTVRLWNIHSGELLHTLRGHDAPVLSVAFSPDGSQFVTAGADKTVRQWNTTDGTLSGMLPEFEGRRLSYTFVIDDAENDQRIDRASADAPFDWYFAATYSPDGNFLAISNTDRTIEVHQVGIDQLLEIAYVQTSRRLTCLERVQFLYAEDDCGP